MRALRAFCRGLRVVEQLLIGALICVVIDLATRFGRRPAWVADVTQWWFRRLIRGLGLRLEVSGRIAPGSLLVANHVSWLDIPLLGAQGHLTFLSKADVRRWPLVGWVCAVVGTEFIERGGNQVARVTRCIADIAVAGGTVVIFPEGTTTEGDRIGRFHPRLFRAAQQGPLAVQPVALSYHCGSDANPDTRIAYVGDQTLIANIWELIRHPGVVARVHWLVPVTSAQREDRRAICARTRDQIATALGLDEASATSPAPLGVSRDKTIGIAPEPCQARS